MLVGFHRICGQHFTLPDPRPLDNPDNRDYRQDPNDDADLELPHQAA
jgi:hypothetical protein